MSSSVERELHRAVVAAVPVPSADELEVLLEAGSPPAIRPDLSWKEAPDL
ncbi:hypothetical protein [Williamsia herbipolensis]|nr:hypothetical protein [Williamsia herbipolensis]